MGRSADSYSSARPAAERYRRREPSVSFSLTGFSLRSAGTQKLGCLTSSIPASIHLASTQGLTSNEKRVYGTVLWYGVDILPHPDPHFRKSVASPLSFGLSSSCLLSSFSTIKSMADPPLGGWRDRLTSLFRPLGGDQVLRAEAYELLADDERNVGESSSLCLIPVSDC